MTGARTRFVKPAPVCGLWDRDGCWCRVAPDPVALPGIDRLLARSQSHVSAIISLVPTDGVEKEASILGQAILQWLAVDDVEGNFCQRLWGQRNKCVRVTAGQQAVRLN